jgi:hypothetical protein
VACIRLAGLPHSPFMPGARRSFPPPLVAVGPANAETSTGRQLLARLPRSPESPSLYPSLDELADAAGSGSGSPSRYLWCRGELARSGGEQHRGGRWRVQTIDIPSEGVLEEFSVAGSALADSGRPDLFRQIPAYQSSSCHSRCLGVPVVVARHPESPSSQSNYDDLSSPWQNC